MLVTGSSGFVGQHLLRRLDPSARVLGVDLVPAPSSHGHRCELGDVRDRRRIAELTGALPAGTVVHLAAVAEVVIPFAGHAELMSINFDGTLGVLEAAEPRHLVLASTSSAYGDAPPGTSSEPQTVPAPLGIYAASKVAAEMACRAWARERGGRAVALRLGNVIGAGCRGLIPFLVRHARRHPDGAVPAVLRGGGALLRDYVPVEHVVDVVLAAADRCAGAGELTVLNVGTGVARSNRFVAEAVVAALAERGLRLAVEFTAPPEPGEATRTAMDVSATRRLLGVTLPDEAAVLASIDSAVAAELAGQ
ncbi:MAG: NAD(P)-dependent oxidoreductase [Ectothiorhodospiraceae bacterium]|nr:NAD(P)-dependent oxidoreductase [Ectothiorhodospiraceae bacterium]